MFASSFKCNQTASCKGENQEKDPRTGLTCHNCAICPYSKERILRQLEAQKKAQQTY